MYAVLRDVNKPQILTVPCYTPSVLPSEVEVSRGVPCSLISTVNFNFFRLLMYNIEAVQGQWMD